MEAIAQRIGLLEVERLPALMNTKEFAALVGYGSTYISRMCKSGAISHAPRPEATGHRV